MSEIDWDRVRTLVGRALELAPEERAAFVELECVGDAALRAEVERLLARVDESPAGFLEPPPQVTGDDASTHHVLGEFEILREIGRGGMGVVYLARQTTLEREVAVKVLVESLTTTEREVERFHREARAVARLRHPGIVQVLTDGRAGTTHWFAMEYVAGHDLKRELQLQRDGAALAGEGPLLPAPGEPDHVTAVARLCTDVAEALHFAHQGGLVHRDVKPANLLLHPDGRVQIGDFGLVRDESLGSLSRTGELAGTPHYMSPEQARVRQVEVDHRTDVYSLGVVLYEALTLRRPFEGPSSADVISQIRDREPASVHALNPRVPRDLALICQTAMAKELESRYADAAALAADLGRFLRHEAIEARPPALSERVRSWGRRHRRAVITAALVAASLGLGAAGAAWRTHGRGLARLSVEAAVPAGGSVAGVARARPVDPVTGAVGEARRLGALPIEGARLEPGYWRVVVELEGGQVRELARSLEPGREQRVQVRAGVPPGDLSEMVLIGGGTLSLRDPGDSLSSLNGRDVPIEPFWLDACEVSNADYRRFLQATGHPPPRHWAEIVPGVHDDLPVVFVGWRDALAFAEWAGKRLPSYPEWVWAARGEEGRHYPWADAVAGELRGNTRVTERAPSNAAGTPYYLAHAADVRSYPEARTASGLYHLFGNVAEWTESLLAESAEGGYRPDPARRLVAGHHWDAGTRGHSLVTFGFGGIERAYAEHVLGFRCARSALP